MVKIKVIKTQKLMEVEPVETESEKKHRRIKNRHKTSRQRKDYPSDNPAHLSKSQRQDAIFPGYETLRKLSKGIAEKKSKVPLCADGMNPNHSKDGKFSDGSDSGSWSSGLNDPSAIRRSKSRKCQRGQSARQGNQQRWTKVPCGRDGRVSKDGKPPTYYRCYDGKKVIPEESIKIPQNSDRQVAFDDLILRLGKKQRAIEKLTDEIRRIKKTKCQKQMSVSDLVKALNYVSLAKKGKAFDEKTTTPTNPN